MQPFLLHGLLDLSLFTSKILCGFANLAPFVMGDIETLSGRRQTYQLTFHCLQCSECARITKNNGFYLVSLLPPSVPKVLHRLLFTCSFSNTFLFSLSCPYTCRWINVCVCQCFWWSKAKAIFLMYKFVYIGFQIVEGLKEQCCNIPIIVLSLILISIGFSVFT